MFTDLTLNEEVQRHFADHLDTTLDATGTDPSSPPASLATAARAVDLSVRVLTVGYWPTYPPTPVAMPPALVAAQASHRLA